MIPIVLVGEVDLVRGALAALLAHEDDLAVTSEFSLHDDVVTVARAYRSGVVVVDIDHAGDRGLGVVDRLAQEAPACRMLVLTRQRTPEVLRRVLAANVRGLLGTDASPEQVARSIRTVAAGEHVIDPALAAAALLPADNPLTEQERLVLRLAGEGLRSREIAEQLYLSSGTVRNYLSAAIRKTGARNRLGAVQRAREEGWI